MKLLIINITESKDKLGFSEELGYSVEFASSVQEASEKTFLYDYDCIITYCNLFDIYIDALFNAIETSNKTSGLIILSEEKSVEQKVKFLLAGADDYIIHPCHPEELKARIIAIVRRKKFNSVNKIHFANTVIDLNLKSIMVWNNPVSLTRKEYEILIYLIMNRNITVTSTGISEYLWGEEAENKGNSNLLVSHIKNLRKKLKLAKAEIEIKNLYGMGYQIIEL